MRRYKRLYTILLAGTLIFSSIPAFPVSADILSKKSNDWDAPAMSEDNTVSADILGKKSNDWDAPAMSEDNTVSADTLSKKSSDWDTPVLSEDNTISEDILSEKSNDLDTPALSENNTVNAEQSNEDRDDGGYFGYVEPEWAGNPVPVNENITIDDIDDMVKGDEIIITEDGFELHVEDMDSIQPDYASIEPMSEYTDEIPAAFPAAYGTGGSELANIDSQLAGRLTATRDQSPYGSCWAHEAIALTEAYRINKQGGNASTIDNSERHLVYNTYNTGTTQMGLDSYDTAQLNGANEEIFLDQGGDAIGAAQTLSKWRGVAKEGDAPYSTIGSDSWENTEFLSSAGRIENCYVISLKDNPDVVKRFIREYGAVGVSYHTFSGMKAMTEARYYNSETNAYYRYDAAEKTNHGVALVGWDDNFPASAFAHDPGENGAWLVRNSWKVGGSVAEKSYDSYFWMSYKDKGLEKGGKAYVYKMQEDDQLSEHNYFYDAMFHENQDIYFTNDSAVMESANVYRVSGSDGYENLDAVTFQTFNSNRKNDNSYRVEIYADLTDASKPDSGALIAVKEGELPFLGLYTVSFDTPVLLKKGTHFSVVVIVNGGGKSVDIEKTITKQGQIEKDSGPVSFTETYTAGSGVGQSFYKEKSGKTWTDINGSGYANFCIDAHTSDVEGDLCNVTVYSRTYESADSIADLSITSAFGGGTVVKGEEVTVIAPDMTQDGYTFLGWCLATEITDGKVTDYNDTIISEYLRFTFIADEDIALVAIYRTSADASLTVRVENGARYTFGGDIYNKNLRFTSCKLGQSYKVMAADPDKVLYWKNEDGKVIGRRDTVSVTLTRDTIITLYYKDTTEDQAYLQFVSDYGQVLSCDIVSSSDAAYSYPTVPTKYGYDFVKWVFSGTDIEATYEAIKAKIGTESIITVVPKYTKDATTYTVTVNYMKEGISFMPSQSYNNRAVGTGFEVEAPDVVGAKFECWKDGAETVLGYNKNYFMVVTGDVTLQACYVDDSGADVAKKPVIVLTGIKKTDPSQVHKVIGEATRSIPEGNSLIEHGMLYAKTALSEDAFVYGTEGVNRYVSADEHLNGVLYMNIKVSSDDLQVYFRGYMVVKDNSTGNIKTYYTNIRHNSYNDL